MLNVYESTDLNRALAPVVDAFDSLEVPYYIGGSVASSFHGALRSTMDVDLSAQLTEAHLVPFLQAIEDQYYVSEAAAREAVRRKTSFNLLHNETSFKVDIFVSRQRDFDRSVYERIQRGELDDSHDPLTVMMPTPEDIILLKLEWYRLGNEVSERQWNDLTRLVEFHRDSLDMEYLLTWAMNLRVADLWQRLYEEVAAKYRD